jgi:ketosteroid isomerase-like protein
MTTNRQIVTDAFAAWSTGTGDITDLFAEDMRWEITGRCVAGGVYQPARQFVEEVLTPFGARFTAQDPFRPVLIRGIHEDPSTDMVIVAWNGAGTTTIGTTYTDTVAWLLRMRDGKVVEGTAFFDSIAFNELWQDVPA